MIVRYVGDLPAYHKRLTAGAAYVVIAMSAENNGSTRLLLLDDRSEPTWCESGHLDLVSAEVPSTWRVRAGHYGNCGSLDVGPAPFLEPGFLEAYWGDGDEAALEVQEIFRQEVTIIVEEAGGPPS
ncbi:MAG: hypothetical protein ACKVUT_03545 [Gaiella sp.]